MAVRHDVNTLVRTGGPGRRVEFGQASSTWMGEGLCAQVDPETFFPEKGGSARAARATCLACDVRGQCLEWAIIHNERGIWGGTNDKERAKLRRERVLRDAV